VKARTDRPNVTVTLSFLSGNSLSLDPKFFFPAIVILVIATLVISKRDPDMFAMLIRSVLGTYGH